MALEMTPRALSERLTPNSPNRPGEFLRRLALNKSINDRPSRTMRKKLIKTGAKVVSRFRYVTFHCAQIICGFTERLEFLNAAALKVCTKTGNSEQPGLQKSALSLKNAENRLRKS